MKIIKYPLGSERYLLKLKPFKIVLNTNGDGFWSTSVKKVTHSKAYLSLWDEEMGLFNNNKLKFAELQIYFSKRDWDVNKHGLIYTDNLWLKELRKKLFDFGFSKAAVKSVSYSEQGMQGHNYVSLYVGLTFLKQLKDKFSIS